jgi:acyl-CoA synthetase (AMP-forming)/AMP-acid ligase II
MLLGSPKRNEKYSRALMNANHVHVRMRVGTIPKMAQASAERFGDASAIVEGDRHLSFVDVVQEMRAVARSLVAVGVEPGDRVAIWAPNCAGWITAALGVHAAGAWLVPINTRFTGAEAAYILGKTDARVLFTSEGFLGRDYVGSVRAAAPGLRALKNAIGLPLPGSAETRRWAEFLSRGEEIPMKHVEDLINKGQPGDISDVIFTSGTTGMPKGVMLRHGTSLHGYRIFADRFGLRAGDRYVVPTPFFHCFGYKAGWMISLMTGAVTYPLAVFDAAAVLELVHRERITHFPGSPTMFRALLDHPRRNEFELSSLRHAVIGAASIPAELVYRVREELGIVGILSAYGLTENHALVSLTAADDPPEIVATTVGIPLPGVQVRIVDDSGSDLSPGQQGELCIKSPFVMSGYFDDDQATAVAVDDGWLHTGDVGFFDDGGYLHITDRKKDMFIVGGFNVASAEVEKVLLGLAAVGQVAVVGMPDDYLGEVGVAFVIPRQGAQVSVEEVIAYAREHLANYKVPRRVEIVDAFPVNATGKVLKTELRERARRRFLLRPHRRSDAEFL